MIQRQPMPMYEVQNKSQRAQTVTMLISLFLMVICFFIMLVSISSQHAANSAGAMKSVHKTFGKANKLSVLPAEGMSIIKPIMPTPHPGNVIVAIADTLSATFKNEPLQLSKTERALRFTIPLTEVYEVGNYELQLSMEKIFSSLKALLPKEGWNHLVDVSCMIAMPEVTEKVSPATLGMLEQLAREAEENWAYPTGSIAIGLTSADLPMAIFTFTRR